MKTQAKPVLSAVLTIFGILDVVSGIFICGAFWPGRLDASMYGQMPAYAVSALGLAAGITSGVLFFAAAAIIDYLSQIRTGLENTNWLLAHRDSGMES